MNHPSSAGGLDYPATDRTESEGRVLLEILIHGPLSRVELAQRLGLSSPSLTRVTKPLISAGVLIEGPAREQAIGRPSRPLDIDVRAEHFVGVKLTDGALYAVVTDLRGTVLAEQQRPLPDTSPAQVAADITTEIQAFERAFAPMTAIGISLGGRAPDGRTVSEANFLGWHDVPLADLVEQACGRTVVVANDVNALTQSEHWFGAGRGLNSFAVITIGAGVGLGLVAHNELVVGAHGGAGSIGHQLLTASSITCWRGHRGCANALLSTAALESTALLETGLPVPLDDLRRGAERGNPQLRRIVDSAGEALGLLVASVVNAFDPMKIVIAGEGAWLGIVGEHAMLQAFRDAEAWDEKETPIEVQPIAFDQWARGAAVCAIRGWALR